MSAKIFEASRFDENGSSDTKECVVEEGALQVRVNGKPFTVTMRTPGDDRRLIQGLLFSEGLVEKPADIISLREEPAQDKGGVTVWSVALANAVMVASENFSNRSLMSTSSCGLCGKTEWNEPTRQGSHEGCPDGLVFPQAQLSR